MMASVLVGETRRERNNKVCGGRENGPKRFFTPCTAAADQGRDSGLAGISSNRIGSEIVRERAFPEWQTSAGCTMSTVSLWAMWHCIFVLGFKGCVVNVYHIH